ncbi:MAG: dTMP kinase [Candidatus Nanohalobium sp.]
MRENDFSGSLIVVEGADGSGTTTQAEKLSEELDAFYTAEPAANKIGEKVDEMISEEGYSAEAIALAFSADRMVHLEEEVIPRLKEGETVVVDRYYHSTFVYQPALGAEYEWVKNLNREALRPDLTIILDVSKEVALSRIGKRESNISEDLKEGSDLSQSRIEQFSEEHDANIFEDLSFQEEVTARYRQLPKWLDEEVVTVDGKPGIEEVFSNVRKEVKDNLGL